MPSRDIPLAIGYWLVSHKATLRRWWAIMLLAVMFIAGIWAIAAVGLATAQAGHITSRMEALAKRLPAFSPRSLGQPVALRVHDVTVIRRDAQRADVVAFLQNPNTDWGAARVHYSFVLGATTTPDQTTWVNPGEDRPVILQNIALTTDVQPSITVAVSDWARVTSRTPIPSFTVTKPTWAGTRVAIGPSSVETITVEAKVRNESVYNYYQVRVPILVRSENGLVAVDELVLDRWNSRDTKNVTTSWTYPIPSVASVEMRPSVSAFDASNRF